jgi:hypothetical protein
MKSFTRLFLILCLAFLLAGCGSAGGVVDPSKPVPYVDLPTFDEEVKAVLRRKPETVKIEMLDKIKPSQIPERLRSWITAAQKAGGKVDVALPEGEIQPRGLPLLSLLTSILGSFVSADTFRGPPADLRGYDVKIQLKSDAGGDRYIEQIVFQRSNQ